MSDGAHGVVVLTDRGMAADAGHELVDAAAAALDGGAAAVLLREKDLPAGERHHLARRLRAATAARGAELWLAGDPALAAATGADAVHLAAADPWPAPVAGLRRGRSCHSRADLVAARDAGADHVTYSPVFPTESKPTYGPALGIDGLRAGCRTVPDLSVIALGGLEPGRARECLAAGASAVALMGAVMRAGDPAAVVRAVVDEMQGARP